MDAAQRNTPQTALDFTQVLSNPGARISLDRSGEFVVTLPRSCGPANLSQRFRAWICPASREAHAAKVDEHSRNKMASRFQSSPVDRGRREFRLLALRPQQPLSPAERKANRAANSAVAQAFIRQIEAGVHTDPSWRVLAPRLIRERLVEMPPKVFASQLAQRAFAMSLPNVQQRKAVQARHDEFVEKLARMPGGERTAPKDRERIVSNGIGMWYAAAVGEARRLARQNEGKDAAAAQVSIPTDHDAVAPYISRAILVYLRETRR